MSHDHYVCTCTYIHTCIQTYLPPAWYSPQGMQQLPENREDCTKSVLRFQTEHPLDHTPQTGLATRWGLMQSREHHCHMLYMYRCQFSHYLSITLYLYTHYTCRQGALLRPVKWNVHTSQRNTWLWILSALRCSFRFSNSSTWSSFTPQANTRPPFRASMAARWKASVPKQHVI